MVRCILRRFESVFGLKINFSKNTLVSIKEEVNLDMLAANLGVDLGIPIGAPYKRMDIWILVEQKLMKTLSGWRAQYLSKGGKLTLIRTSLENILVYMSLFVILSSVALQRRQANCHQGLPGKHSSLLHVPVCYSV